MARDLNRLFDDLRNSREVYVTRDGEVERADEADDNARLEERRSGDAKPRTRLKPEVFGESEQTLFVRDGVLTELHELAQQYPVETGAIGVGPDEHTVTEVIPSGPSAKRSAGSFELDAEYLQPLLERAEKRGLRFVAFWHSHPAGCARPSGIDRAAARRMLNDPDWGLPGHVYLPISMRTKTGFATRFFLARGRSAEITEPTTVVLSSETTPGREPASARVPALGGAHLGLDDRLIRERIASDLVELKAAGWTASVRRSPHGTSLRTESRRIVLWLVLPPEYPLSPPDVFVEEGDGLRRIPASDVPELVPWSSLRSSAVALEQARKSVEDLRAVESRIVHPWTSPILRLVEPARTLLPFIGGAR